MQSVASLKGFRLSTRTLQRLGALIDQQCVAAPQARGYKTAQENRQEASGFARSESRAPSPSWEELRPRTASETDGGPLDAIFDGLPLGEPERRLGASRSETAPRAYQGQTKVEEVLPAHGPSETSFWNDILPEHYLRVKLGDDKVRRFDPVFLRDSCQCPLCVDEHSGQKKFDTASIPPDIRVKETTRSPNGMFTIYWENDVRGFHNHHTKLPPWWFTRQTQRALRDPAPKVRPWNEHYMNTVLEHMDFHRYMTVQEDYDRTLKTLYKFGLVIIQNVPEDPMAVERIGEKIGPLRHTFYGRTWDVKDKPKAENVAYTSGFLGLHMDLLYMKNPPGLQLLHCIKAAGQGGESIFSDALHAANVLKSTSPEAFNDLATFPVTYHYTKGGHHFMDHKPVIQLDEHDPNNIAHVNWSPPFQGPFTINNGLADNGRALRNWHRAARAFDHVLNEPTNLYEYRLKEGDCVIFDNRRVLHGRKAFTSGTPVGGDPSQDNAVRWLKGAYLDHDDFRSQVRGMIRRSQRSLGDTRRNNFEYKRLRTEERRRSLSEEDSSQ